LRDGFAEVDDGGLGSGVGGRVGRGVEGVAGCDVDDRSATFLQHLWDRGVHEPQRGVEVAAELATDVGPGGVGERADGSPADVVDEQVMIFGGDQRGNVFELFPLGEVGHDRAHNSAMFGTEFARGTVEDRRIPRDQGEFAAPSREFVSKCPADAARPAGDERETPLPAARTVQRTHRDTRGSATK